MSGNRVAKALMGVLPTLALAGAFAAGISTTPQPAAWAGDGTCRTAWCQQDGLEPAIDAMIEQQVTALGCDDRQRLTDRVAVRNTKAPNAGVVRVVDFDTAWSQAKAGKVWVVGWC